jgi:2-polyprenyl-3-methyl-5-hydroxy-6-metoxy-1,4-benzoquinol methylase
MTATHVEYGWRTAGPQGSHEYLLPAALEEVARAAEGGPMRILDLGCGSGYVAAELARRGHEVVGVDVSADGIRLARDTYEAELPGLRFHACSVYDDDFAERVGGAVDCVLSLEVVEHLYLPRALFAQARRLLRPGGSLVVSTPYHGYLKNLAISLAGGWDRHFGVDWDGGHVKFFSPATLRRMAAEAGFEGVRFRGIGRAPLLWKSTMMTARA